MGFSIGSIMGVGGALIQSSADANKKNADAIRRAAESQSAAAIESARIYTEAAKEAAALSQKAAETRRTEDIAAANEAAAKSEQYLMDAIPKMQEARQAGVDFTNTEFAAAYDTINKAYQPYIDQGAQADQRINALNFGTTEEKQNALSLDPGYQFRQDQSQNALARKQIGQGAYRSGAADVELMKQSQGMASDEFTNAYNRLMNISTRGQSVLGTVSGNKLALAGTRSQGAQSMAGLGEQNARDISNTRTIGAENVLRATTGGNAGIQTAATQGAQGVYGATVQGREGVQNALSNQYTQNANADIMRNNFWPEMGWKAVDTAVQLYGASKGGAGSAGGQGGGNSFYVPPQPNNSLNYPRY